MSSSNTCSECGKVIPADSPEGYCAQCLLGLGLARVPEPPGDRPGRETPAGQERTPEQHGKPPDESGASAPACEEDDSISPAVLTEKAGDLIGRYRLLQEIGNGGCGVVYMAEQKEPVRRRVALKVIKLGMDTKQVVARFAAERQALALMDHPNIARVLDAGTTQTGRPYFVMELVGGIKITDYCDRNQLSTHQRLELFIQVCHAIQHAHQKGVIHRDIKPSNVLVATQDGLPMPKVIDFGIAKATQGRLTDQTLFTAFEQFIGTPAYMSPEQAQLGALDVDTRSDIYSLGVLLYELLTGRTPFDTRELLAAGLDEMRRTIREKEPSRPSTRLSTMAQSELTTTAQHRSSEVPRLIHLIRGDLDWIVMKCLEKDRAHRYETANGLARDIERHLASEPVVARPPGAIYRLHKFIRRNRITAVSATAIATVLVLGVAVSTWQAVNARRAEREQSRLREAAQKAGEDAQRARQDATEKLWSSYLSEARARRVSGQSGRRFESLRAIREAAAIRPSLELRNEAIACMVLADIQLLERKSFPQQSQMVAGDPSLEHFAVCERSGSVSIRRLSDGIESAHLPAVGPLADGICPFSPDGKWLAVFYADNRWRVWDWAKSRMVLEVASTPAGAAEFAPDARRIAVSDSTNIVVHDLPSGEKLNSISLNGLASKRAPGWLRFDPSGRRLALFTLESDSDVLILDARSGQEITTLPHTGHVFAVAWHPDGRQLATASGEGSIHIWNASNGKRLRTWHTEQPISVAFNHQGSLLASCGWDGKTRLWEFPSGRQPVSIRKGGNLVGFGPSDRALVSLHWDGTGLDFLETEVGLGLRTLHERLEGTSGIGGQAAFIPGGKLVAGGTPEGVRLWDIQTGWEVALLGDQDEDKRLLGFDAEEKNLILTGPAGLFRWPITNSPAAPGPVMLVNTACADPVGGRMGAVSADGRLCGIVGDDRCQIFRTDTFAKQAETGLQPGMRFIALSPSGALLASGAWQHSGIVVWDATTGAPIKELPVRDGDRIASATVVFSPDGRYLVTSVLSEYCFWEVGAWTLARRISQHPDNDFPAAMAFTPDGKIFAGTHSRNVVRLYDAATSDVLADLEAPNSREVTSLSFNHDGTQLAACESRDALRIWDLKLIREQLASMGLDWEQSPHTRKPDGSVESRGFALKPSSSTVQHLR